MARKYEKYLMEMKEPFRQEDQFKGKAARHFMIGSQDFEMAGWLIDSVIIYGGGVGFHADPKGRATPHSHPVGEMFLFIGTNPEDPTDLGGEHVMWLGEGADAEEYVMTKSTLLYVPPFLVHCPHYCRKAWGKYIYVVALPNIAGQFAKNPAEWPKGYEDKGMEWE